MKSKVIIINVCVLLFLFLVLEFSSYLCLRKDGYDFIKSFNDNAKATGGVPLTQRYAPVSIYDAEGEENMMRPVAEGENDKKTLLFFGCSYMYGAGLPDEGTLPYQIYEKTKRTVINRSVSGGSIVNTIYDLKHQKLYNALEKYQAPEYIFFILINDHSNRIINPYKSTVSGADNPRYYLNIGYKVKDGVLEESTPNKLLLPFYMLYTTKAWHLLFASRFLKETPDEIMLNLMTEAKKITDEKFPGSKFVVIDYKDGGHVLMSDELKNGLIKNNFIVFDAEKLAGHELISEDWRGGDKEHPNAEAFKDVATGLINELNL